MPNSKLKILISESSLFYNRVDWFDMMGKFTDITVLFSEKTDSDSDSHALNKESDNFVRKFIKGITLPKIGKITRGVIKEIKKNPKKYDIIFLDGYGYFSQLLNIKYLNRHNIPYVINVDGIDDKQKKARFLNRIKHKVISSAPYFLCGSKATNNILIKFGAKKENIYNHVFTSLYEKDLFYNIAEADEKQRLRRELNISEKFIVLSVGRFSYLNGYGKGYDVLISAAKDLPEDIGFYIVGGEPTEEFVQMSKNLKNVHFVDFTEKQELKKYYRAADVFVLMSVSEVWGLVINEAMACGVPVITTDRCIAGDELVREDKNGYLLKVGDVKGLTEKLKFLYSNEEKVKEMGKNAISTIKPYTIENMAKQTVEILTVIAEKEKHNGNSK